VAEVWGLKRLLIGRLHRSHICLLLNSVDAAMELGFVGTH
jgi:hypothetical protein